MAKAPLDYFYKFLEEIEKERKEYRSYRIKHETPDGKAFIIGHPSQESTDIQTNTEEKQEVYACLYKNTGIQCGTVYRKQACLLAGQALYHYDIYLTPEVAGIDSDEEEVYFGGTGNLDYWLANFSEKLKVVK